ncbi:MAG: glycosyltransferase family 2 protein [Candidatus Omnitrophota bacterium]|nr:MAG: glycosyltransferase family 2 protein [Candidatus Omnitrophota bacterium]
MSIRVSAIICTYNRAEYLRKAIQSLTNQTLHKDQYEILIVDNGGTDNTQQVVKKFSNVGNIRYIYEPISGLSQARNAGWLNAKGEYVAYLDDDAIASPQWFEKILEAFETVKPKPGCVGGKIEPIWEAPKPIWLSDKTFLQLTVLDWSPIPIFLNDKQWLAGANIAYPQKLLKDVGGFKTTLGRRGNRLFSMEENLVRIQLEKMGYRCYYHPEIVVRHHILPQRLTKKWFLRKSYLNGVSSALIKIYLEAPSLLNRLQKGFTTIIRILFSPRELISLIAETSDPEMFALKCSVLARLGNIMKLWGLAR